MRILFLVGIGVVMAVNGHPNGRACLSRQARQRDDEIGQPARSSIAPVGEKTVISDSDTGRREGVQNDSHKQSGPGEIKGCGQSGQVNRDQNKNGSWVPGMGGHFRLVIHKNVVTSKRESKTLGDHYGGHAEDYAKHRPTYPEELFKTILAHCPSQETVWDCGTGNGQVAVRLAEDFHSVLATDISSLQLEHAEPHPRISYHCCNADDSPFESSSVDLITVATAVHWFNLEAFFREADRVLKPGGLLVVWTYGRSIVGPPSVATIVNKLSDETLGQDWPPGIEWVDKKYRDLPFPYPDLGLGPIEFPLHWSEAELLGWIDTWSAVRRHRARTGLDPLSDFPERLNAVWPEPNGGPITVQFPLSIRGGKKKARHKPG